MYKIYADDTLIYDSTIDDYKIGKGSVSLETNKSGSFTFSLYPDHPFYDNFVRLKTVITVYKSNKIVFRGRILSDVTDFWNNKVLTCEGELGFLQDTIVRPFTFSGSPAEFFAKLINEHNSQVDKFKQFRLGTVTVADANNYIVRSNVEYETTLDNITKRLIEETLGGYIYITHGADGTDLVPTINYVADFTKVSSQRVEFGSNLKDYTKTVNASEIATAIIPLGATVDDGDDETEDKKLTIASVNDGLDYVYDENAVALYGWIFKVVEWEDVTVASNLLTKAKSHLNSLINQNITIELNAIDLHLLNQNIESFGVCDLIRVTSAPHNFDATLLCNKQTIDLLKPENDSYTLGHTYSTFTEKTNKNNLALSNLGNMSIVNKQLQAIGSDISSIITRLSMLETGGLPTGYKKISFIESTGTQWVDTGVIPSEVGYKVDIGYTPTSVPSSGESWIIAICENSGSFRCGFVNNAFYTNNGFSYSQTSDKTGYTIGTGSNTIAHTLSLYLFSQHESSGAVHTSNCKYKLHYCKIYDNNNTLIRDFVPCVTDDGQYGLFNKVNNQFYGNAGTGAFTGA